MWCIVSEIILHILIPKRKHPTRTSASAELEQACTFWAYMGVHVCTRVCMSHWGCNQDGAASTVSRECIRANGAFFLIRQVRKGGDKAEKLRHTEIIESDGKDRCKFLSLQSMCAHEALQRKTEVLY